MTVGNRIKNARKTANMTQKELAEKLGISYVNISQYENGSRNPKLDQIEKIAAALGVGVEKLIDITAAARIREQIKNATINHFEMAKDREAFLHIYNNAFNDKGQRKIHEYAEDLITNKQYLKSGYVPLKPDTNTDE